MIDRRVMQISTGCSKSLRLGSMCICVSSPRKISLRIDSCANLAPRYCVPFEILDKIGPVAYQLALPPTMRVHDVFHISLLKKYIKDVDHFIDWSILQVEGDILCSRNILCSGPKP